VSALRWACLGLVLLATSFTAACKHADGEAEAAAAEGATGVEMLPMEVVTAKSLNVRAIPTTKGTVLGTLKKGQEVRVLETKGGWKKVQSDGAAPEGWVAAQYLKAHGE
jgi:uncharacterized protein YgiM (DUF1202 family)